MGEDDRPPATRGALLQMARKRLANPREAPILVAHALGCPRASLYAHPERTVSDQAAAHLLALLERRRRGEPVAYLLGEREFYGLRLSVEPAVLVPRAETELLVELSLKRLNGLHDPRVLDAGTGSGAIAVALAHARRDARIAASDRSATALAVATTNVRAHGLDNVSLVQGDWLAAFAPEAFDLIVSNPPYVNEDDPGLRDTDLCAEPWTALAAGADGLDAIRRVFAEAPTRLRRGGWLVVEHGAAQQDAVVELARGAGCADVAGHADLAGLPRAVTARRPG